MSVVQVTLRQSELNLSKGVWTGQRVYRVEVDEITDDEYVAMSANDGDTRVPAMGTPFRSGHAAKVVTVKARQLDDDRDTFDVTVDYSSESTAQQSSDANPLEQTPDYQYGGSPEEDPLYFDASPKPADWDDETDGPWKGRPLVTSAFEKVANVPKRPRVKGTITITRNEPDYNDLTAESFKDTVNKSPVTIRGVTYAAGTLRMDNITAAGPKEATIVKSFGAPEIVTYWTITYDIGKNVKGWKLHMPDEGFLELQYDPQYDEYPMDVQLQHAKQRKIVLADGTFPAKEYPLDGKGRARAAPDEQAAVREFLADPEVEWEPLNLS